jgi:hypothetical protein
MGVTPRWDTTYADTSLRDENPLNMKEITSAGHQYASPSPRLSMGCPDRSTKTQTHEPSLSWFQTSREKERVGGGKEIFGEDVVRPRTDRFDPITPLRIFLTLEVSAGVLGDAPRVKEADEMRERDVGGDSSLRFWVSCTALGELLTRSGINRDGVGDVVVWRRVGDVVVRRRAGEEESSSGDNSLRSESDPGAVVGGGRLVPLTFRGESSDFRAFGIG